VGFAGSMKRFPLIVLIIVSIMLTALGLMFFSSQRTREYKSEEFLMDTLVSIRVYGSDTDRLKRAVADAFTEMRRLNDLTDRFALPGTAAFETSNVCQINAAAGIEPVQVDEDVLAILEMAKKYHELTGGVFDITIGPVMDVWGFGRAEQRVPSENELQQALAYVNSKKLVLDKEKRTAFLTEPGMSLDLGAIVKGYATDKAIQILQKHGVKEALLDAGGNIRVLGKKDGKSPWKIGIQDPRNSTNLVAVLSLVDEAAVTSGDYNRFFIRQGKRYHHLISPYTGRPAGENMSVTVVAGNATLADVLSTSLFMLNPEQALKLAGEIQGVDALIIAGEGRILTTVGLQDRVKITSGEVDSFEQR
jgi:thiamine biosynthesis lipoprotein